MALMNYDTFENLMHSGFEVSGKSLTDKGIKFYWNHLRHVDGMELTRGFHVFLAKGRLPSVNELLIECGYRPLESRSDKMEVGEVDQDCVEARDPSQLSGEWTWEHRATTESQTEADRQFAQARGVLERSGWKILSTADFKCQSQPEPRSPARTVFKRQFFCVKEENTTQLKATQPTSDGKAAAANDWSATK